jgi:NADH:ubiquinone oxidoreductase subunit F (NADH-binding)
LVDAVDRCGLARTRRRRLSARPQASGGGEGARAIVVANGCEIEPLSGLLLRELPHLVLDGAAIAARAVGADEAIVAYKGPRSEVRNSLERAIAERRGARIGLVVRTLFEAQDRFLSGQQTALVYQLGVARPSRSSPPRRPRSGACGGARLLIQNGETLAYIALIVRHGGAWYTELGGEGESGSRLLTLAGAVSATGVYEVSQAQPSVTTS